MRKSMKHHCLHKPRLIKDALPPSSFRGSLLTRSLADIVKKEDFVLDSEYLITMLVVVPK